MSLAEQLFGLQWELPWPDSFWEHRLADHPHWIRANAMSMQIDCCSGQSNRRMQRVRHRFYSRVIAIYLTVNTAEGTFAVPFMVDAAHQESIVKGN